MKIVRLPYRRAVRLMFYADAAAAELARLERGGAGGPHLFVHDPDERDTPGHPGWSHLVNGASVDAAAFAAFLPHDQVTQRWSTEQPWLAGASYLDDLDEPQVYGFDWHTAWSDLEEMSRAFRAAVDSIARSDGPDIIADGTWPSPEHESWLDDRVRTSKRRADNFRKIWRTDIAEDGPHQPWARARATFLLSLLDLGVLPPALQLLPQWDRQWWYDAVGYDQPAGQQWPKPIRCWHFPVADVAGQGYGVCGKRMPASGRIGCDVTTCPGSLLASGMLTQRELMAAQGFPVAEVSDGTVREVEGEAEAATAPSRPPHVFARTPAGPIRPRWMTFDPATFDTGTSAREMSAGMLESAARLFAAADKAPDGTQMRVVRAQASLQLQAAALRFAATALDELAVSTLKRSS